MNTIRHTRRVLAAAAALSGLAVSAPSLADTLTCTGSTFQALADGSGNITVTCTPPSSGSTCSLSSTKASIPSTGGSVTLTASCGTVSTWTKDGSQIAGSQSSLTDTYQSTSATTDTAHTYVVSGSGGSAQFSVTQTGTGTVAPPPSGGSVATVCAAAGYTSVQVIEMPWKNGVRYYTKGFTLSNVAVFHFTTPAATSPGNQGRLAGGEWGGGPKLRHAVLSTTPCDFNKGSRLPYDYSDATSPTVYYLVGGSDLYYPVLSPSTDYYLNVKNDPTACSSGACEMYMDFILPAGLY